MPATHVICVESRDKKALNNACVKITELFDNKVERKGISETIDSVNKEEIGQLTAVFKVELKKEDGKTPSSFKEAPLDFGTDVIAALRGHDIPCFRPRKIDGLLTSKTEFRDAIQLGTPYEPV